MRLRALLKILILMIAFISLPVRAANFVQVFDQAEISDPTFKEDQATWQAERENLPIAQAQYLPSIVAQGSAMRLYMQQLPATFANLVDTQGYYNEYTYQINLSQPILDAALWHEIKGVRFDVKSATATYLYSTQDLIARTANAYFEVLKAYSDLRYVLANKAAVYRQLITAEQQYKVGLIAITGVYDAKSAYDQSVADEIADRNNLYNAIEDLRVITGKQYLSLNGLAAQVPLIPPLPNNINAWVHAAVNQNYSLRAQKYTVLSARQNIAQQSAGHLPVFSLSGQWSQVRDEGFSNSPNLGIDTGQLGLTVNFPLYQGGVVNAQTRQATFLYAQQSAKLDYTYREVTNNTRKSFLGLVSFISQIRADKEAIISAESAVQATEAGYIVGTRTMVDLLQALSTLYQSQQKYANDQYDYILEIISLKEAAGTLSVKDVVEINSWLHQAFKFPRPPVSYGDAYDVSQKTTQNIIKSYKSFPVTKDPTINLPSSVTEPTIDEEPINDAPIKLMPKLQGPVGQLKLPAPKFTQPGYPFKSIYPLKAVNLAKAEKALKPQKAKKTVKKAKLVKVAKAINVTKPTLPQPTLAERKFSLPEPQSKVQKP